MGPLPGPVSSPGSEDGTGNAARFNGPSGVAVDSAGILYVADFGNYAIRKGWLVPQLTIAADGSGGFW